ncbi:cell division protein FtsQ/DivIB [Demequina sp.]|uniref:cell division protein FtsQ/DivIB n=1 Tax=Demequina sp. TaxID=2050685 RepID=UPI003D0BC2C1
MSEPTRPSRPPAAPQWARVSTSPPTAPQPRVTKQAAPARPAAPKPAPRKPAPPVASPPERRAGTALTDAGKSTVSALTVVLEKARATVVPPLAERRDEREAERRKAKQRRRAIVWGRRAGYVIIAGAAVWLVLLSPVFALDSANVQVSGYGTVVDPAEVREVVDASEGASLATFSVGHLASQLKDIPGVREAHVERSWPDGLVITLESREPVAAIPDPKGGFDLVDDEGIQVGRSAKAPKDLPSLAVPEDNEKVLQAALGVINTLPDELRNRVDSMSAATTDSVSFKLSKGPRVEWGSAEDSALKAQVLTVLLESKKAKKADIIDVSAPTLPITKNN